MNTGPQESPAVKLAKLKEIPCPTAVLGMDASPDDATLFAACLDGSVLKIDVESGRIEPVGKHDSYASAVALMPDGRTLVSAGYDGVIQWHDLAGHSPARKRKVHAFWCWDMDVAPDGSAIASVTGQYLAGGPRYEPAPETEPGIKILDAATGEVRHALNLPPPVQAVAFSPDGKHVAAANMMGDIGVWEVDSGKVVHRWNTPGFTSWGVIKSHHFLGGIFDLVFNPAGKELYVCGMGPMHDPMAGNGTQLWQRFDWRTGAKLDETHGGESGQGLMEAIAFHPSKPWFVMAGRLFQGQWNLAVFDAATGRNLHAIDAKGRITDMAMLRDGKRLVLGKAKGQEKKKDGQWPAFGMIEIYGISAG